MPKNRRATHRRRRRMPGAVVAGHDPIVFTHKASAVSAGEIFVSTASITPTAGSLLIVMELQRYQENGAPAFSGTLGGTWTLEAASALNVDTMLRVYTCPDYNPSGVLTLTHIEATHSQIQVFQAVNAPLSSPIKQWQTANGTTSTTQSVALDLAPTGQCVGFFGNVNGHVHSAGASFTRLAHSEADMGTMVEFDTDGDGEQTIDATTPGNGGKFCVIGVEFN